MTTNHSIAQRITEFIDRIHTLTGWTLTPSVVERGVMFDSEKGCIFYPWSTIDGIDSDVEVIAREIIAAQQWHAKN